MSQGNLGNGFKKTLCCFFLFSDFRAIRVHSLHAFWLSSAAMKARSVNSSLKKQTKSPTQQIASTIWVHNKLAVSPI